MKIDLDNALHRLLDEADRISALAREDGIDQATVIRRLEVAVAWGDAARMLYNTFVDKDEGPTYSEWFSQNR